MPTLLNLLLLSCFPSYKPDVSLTHEVCQLPEEAVTGLVLIVQLGGVAWNGEHLQLSRPKEWLLIEMRGQTQKEQLICILT